MERSEFRRLLESIEELGIDERRAVRAVLEEGRAHVEERIVAVRSSERPSCPHCADFRVIRWGSARGLPRFRCKGCRRTFNPLTGTPLARLKKRSRWGRHAECLGRGDVLREVATRCGVHISTAHRWRHRFLTSAVSQGPEIGGIVEADDTWLSRSAKGQSRLRQSWGREARRRASDQQVVGRSREQVYVVVARDRSGRTRDVVLDQVNRQGLINGLRPHLAVDAVLCSDGWRAYAGAAATLGVRHEVLNASRSERRRGPFHLQNVNNYHGRWKGWMHRFNGVATSYLENYAAWFRHLDANTRDQNPKVMLDLALAG